MNELTPLMAASLANSVYLLKESGKEKEFALDLNTQVTRNFDFDLDKHRITGVSGSIVSRLFNRKTGFAAIGKGKCRYAVA